MPVSLWLIFFCWDVDQSNTKNIDYLSEKKPNQWLGAIDKRKFNGKQKKSTETKTPKPIYEFKTKTN